MENVIAKIENVIDGWKIILKWKMLLKKLKIFLKCKLLLKKWKILLKKWKILLKKWIFFTLMFNTDSKSSGVNNGSNCWTSIIILAFSGSPKKLNKIPGSLIKLAKVTFNSLSKESILGIFSGWIFPNVLAAFFRVSGSIPDRVDINCPILFFTAGSPKNFMIEATSSGSEKVFDNRWKMSWSFLAFFRSPLAKMSVTRTSMIFFKSFVTRASTNASSVESSEKKISRFLTLNQFSQ